MKRVTIQVRVFLLMPCPNKFVVIDLPHPSQKIVFVKDFIDKLGNVAASNQLLEIARGV
jgi:hypothetical protein